MYVATFYSYKGGVGRTLALLNVAYELANAGLRVLVVDFDLEAPAIHAQRWKRTVNGLKGESLAGEYSHPGIVEFISEYLTSMRAPRVEGYITDATPEGCKGEIALMPSGKLDDSYGQRLNMIDWHELYADRDGYVMFEDLRAQWEQLGFDYVLLDSRTGFTDVGGICTRHLPDAVVTMFRPDDQSLRGMEGIVKLIREERPSYRRAESIQLHFVMAAIPDADDEDGIFDKRRASFKRRLSIPAGQLLEIRHYQSMDLLTQPIYTDTRPRTKLALSFKELTRRVRALNVGDREGILDSLQSATPMIPEQGATVFFDRIRRHYESDHRIIAELAGVHGSRGDILESADLLERAASLGSLTPSQWMRLAHARRLTRDPAASLVALKSFFQQPPESTSTDVRSGSRLVQRGLNLLEAAEVDRVPYVENSPIIAGLPASFRAQVAFQLDLSPGERRVAIKILEEVLKSDDGSPEQSADWAWHLAFARMAVGDFKPAFDYFQSEMAESRPHAGVQTAFNLAMAVWAVNGVADPEAFGRVLEFLDAHDDKTWLANNPNNLQAIAVAEWFGNRVNEASRRLQEAEQAIQGQRTDVSCWSYTRVPPGVFIDDCREIRKLFDGEDILPAFMLMKQER